MLADKEQDKVLPRRCTARAHDALIWARLNENAFGIQPDPRELTSEEVNVSPMGSRLQSVQETRLSDGEWSSNRGVDVCAR